MNRKLTGLAASFLTFPLHANPCVYANAFSQMGPRGLEGISYFEKLAAEPYVAHEVGTPGSETHYLVEYWPRHGAYRLIYGEQNYKVSLSGNGSYYYNNSNQPARGQGIGPEVLRGYLKRTPAQLGVNTFPGPRLNGEPLKQILEVQSSKPAQFSEFQRGDIVLAKVNEFRRDSWIVGPLDRFVESPGYPGDPNIRILYFDEWPSLDNYIFTITKRIDQHPSEYFATTQRTSSSDGDESSQVRNLINPSEGARLWKIPASLAGGLKEYLPITKDIAKEMGISREAFVFRLAVDAMQYIRWGLREAEIEREHGTFDGGSNKFPPNFAANLRIPDGGYEAAIATLVHRFDSKLFIELVDGVFQRHFQNLHGREIIDPGAYWSMHTDVTPLDPDYLAIANDTILASYPLSQDMRENGYVVNIIPLFGDETFWDFLGTVHPPIFDELVNKVLSYRAFTVKSYGKTFEVNPVGVIRDYFPEAYQAIRKFRPDFTRDTSDPSIKPM